MRPLLSQYSIGSVTSEEGTPLLLNLSGARGHRRNASDASSISLDGSRRSVSRTVGAARNMGVANLLQRTGSGRMHDQSIRVRENAAEHFETTHTEWMYTRNGIITYATTRLIYNVAIGIILFLDRNERRRTYLWTFLFLGTVCSLFQIIFVILEHNRRLLIQALLRDNRPQQNRHIFLLNGMVAASSDSAVEELLSQGRSQKGWEYFIDAISFVNWVVGLYTILTAGSKISTAAPLLFWCCVVIFSIDIFFIFLPCILGLAICCCLGFFIRNHPQRQDPGANEADLERLPRYIFRRDPTAAPTSSSMTATSSLPSSTVTPIPEAPESSGVMTRVGNEEITRSLPDDDAHCCICWSAYEDGAEIQELPCYHHFHKSCIDKWLRINATCPLCKGDIGGHTSHIAEP